MSTCVEWKSTCDICGGGFAAADLHHVVRLDQRDDGSWQVVGFGSGRGTIFVHPQCLVARGKRAEMDS